MDGNPKQPPRTCNWCWDPLSWWRRWWTRYCATCRRAFAMNAPSPPKPSGKLRARSQARDASLALPRNGQGMLLLGPPRAKVEDRKGTSAVFIQEHAPTSGSLGDIWLPTEYDQHTGEVYSLTHGRWARIDEALPEVGKVTATPKPPAGPAPWVQPTGAHDAYSADDEVTFDGRRWISTVNNNVLMPPLNWLEIDENGHLSPECHCGDCYEPLPDPRRRGATREEIRQAQRDLIAVTGRDIEVDGLLGPRVRQMLKAFQHEHGLDPTGDLTVRTIERLEIAAGVARARDPRSTVEQMAHQMRRDRHGEHPWRY